jgi:hypothetical protein
MELQPEDLLAARFETRPGPLDDVYAAGRALRQRSIPWLAEWHRAVVPRMTPATGLVLMLLPPTGPSFDFEVPLDSTLEDGLEWIMSRPKESLGYYAEDFASLGVALPAPVREIAAGRTTGLAEVCAGLRSLHAAAVEPYRHQVNLLRDADVALRSLRGASTGLAAMVGDLHPSVRLRGMTLEVDRPWDLTLRSSGCGLIFLPSPWLRDEVRVQFAPDQPTMIAYPARLPLITKPTADGSPTPLGRLLGGTRARLLAALAPDDGPGTLALAAELGISAATASEHLAVLRDTQLVDTGRGRAGATHRLTATGRQLLGLNLAVRTPAGP